jgi:hypothetical protein
VVAVAYYIAIPMRVDIDSLNAYTNVRKLFKQKYIYPGGSQIEKHRGGVAGGRA